MNLEAQNVIASEYLKGISSPILAKRFGVSVPTVMKYLYRNGVQIRNRSESRRQYKLDETTFDTINEESSYWIGFLMGDGNINILESGQKLIEVGLAVEDSNHLLKFRDFLKSDYKLKYLPSSVSLGRDGKKYISQPSVRITITSKKLVDKLLEYGVVPNKSLTTKAPEILLKNRNFWRGLIDADGTLDTFVNYSNNYYPRVRLVGSYNLMVQYLGFVKSVVPYECNVTVRSVKSIFVVSIGGKNAIFLMDYLYTNSGIYLDRKYKSMINIMNLNLNLGVN